METRDWKIRVKYGAQSLAMQLNGKTKLADEKAMHSLLRFTVNPVQLF